MQRGFTSTELIVLTAILAILLVAALPQYVRANIREREEEVKSNIHMIQVALERYAVDSGGYYPIFLVGAEHDNNILVSYRHHRGNGVSQFPVHGMTPFSMARGRGTGTLYNPLFSMDALLQYGYMSDYPKNPFARPGNGLWNAYADTRGGAGVYPYGGFHGDVMFDLGFGWGDTPQTDFILYTTEWAEENQAQESDGSIASDPDLDAPGNFYYHPIFIDEIPVLYHYGNTYERVYMGAWSEDSSSNLMRDEVVGYFLYGYGGPGDRDSLDKLGLDFFNRMPANHNMPVNSLSMHLYDYGMPLDSSVGASNQQRVEATGYPACEYDPWSNAWPGGVDPYNPDEVNENRMSGPDGVNDWVIIEVTSGVAIGSEG